jgi:hypothetical protein
MGIGGGGNQEVGHADSTMAASASQLPLHAECRLPVASRAAFEAIAGPTVTARYPFGNATEFGPTRVYR